MSKLPPIHLCIQQPEGYVQGSGALNDTGYARAQDELVWHRRDKRVYPEDDQGKEPTIIFYADVALDAPLSAPQGPTACKMSIHLGTPVCSHAGNHHDRAATL